mgnify:CR=1 FL=1
MRLSDFDFELPAELIAQHPPAERGASRLLVVRAGGAGQWGAGPPPVGPWVGGGPRGPRGGGA